MLHTKRISHDLIVMHESSPEVVRALVYTLSLRVRQVVSLSLSVKGEQRDRVSGSPNQANHITLSWIGGEFNSSEKERVVVLTQ